MRKVAWQSAAPIRMGKRGCSQAGAASLWDSYRVAHLARAVIEGGSGRETFHTVIVIDSTFATP